MLVVEPPGVVDARLDAEDQLGGAARVDGLAPHALDVHREWQF